MSYEIKQAVGDYNASGTASVTITPSPNSTVWIAAHQTGSSHNITVTPDAVTQLGFAAEVGDYYIAQAVIEDTSGAPLTISSGAPGILVAVEVSGLTGRALASSTAAGTISGSASPFTLSGPASGMISPVPALALAFGVNAQADNDFSAAGAGYAAEAISWATAPPAGMCLLEFLEVTTAESVAGAFAVTSQYDSYGVAFAVLAEGESEAAKIAAELAAWNSQPLYASMNREIDFTAPTVIGVLPGSPPGSPADVPPSALWGSIVDIFPQTAPTSGTLVANDCASLADASAGNQMFSLPASEITAGTVIPVNATFRTGLVISQVPAGLTFGVTWDGPLFNNGELSGWTDDGRINP